MMVHKILWKKSAFNRINHLFFTTSNFYILYVCIYLTCSHINTDCIWGRFLLSNAINNNRKIMLLVYVGVFLIYHGSVVGKIFFMDVKVWSLSCFERSSVLIPVGLLRVNLWNFRVSGCTISQVTFQSTKSIHQRKPMIERGYAAFQSTKPIHEWDSTTARGCTTFKPLKLLIYCKTKYRHFWTF